MSDFLPFARPDIGHAEIAAVVDVLASGWLTTAGQTAAFEAELSDRFARPALAVNSATAGFDLLWKAIHTQPGDEAIFPVWTFSSPLMSFYHQGGRPVLVDIDPDDFMVRADSVASAVNCKTVAVVPTHFGGAAADLTSLSAITEQNDLFLFEDAAHALPTTHRGVQVGSGPVDASVFSFYATKTMTTGEGGAVVTREPWFARRLRKLSLHGFDRDAYSRYTAGGTWRYDVAHPGFKANLTDIAAAIGRVQLQRLEEMQVRREHIAHAYMREMAELGLSMPTQSDDTHAWHLFPVKLPVGIDRDRFIQRMTMRGVGCSVHFIPLCLHSFWRDALDLDPSSFPNAMAAFERSVSLPIYSAMTDCDVSRVIDTVWNVIRTW